MTRCFAQKPGPHPKAAQVHGFGTQKIRNRAIPKGLIGKDTRIDKIVKNRVFTPGGTWECQNNLKLLVHA